MAEMKEAMNALGEFQEMKSQVKFLMFLMCDGFYNLFSILFISQLQMNACRFLIRKN